MSSPHLAWLTAPEQPPTSDWFGPVAATPSGPAGWNQAQDAVGTRQGVPMTERTELVHYVSPFASAVWMPAWLAETYLEQDDQRWWRLEELQMVSDAQRTVGPPHIDDH
jgi:hypothetical protein